MIKKYLGFFILVCFLIIWEITSDLHIIDPFFVSAPIKVILALYQLFASGEIYPHLIISANEFFGGFALALILGILLGLLIGSSKFLSDLTRPFITVFYNMPRIILLPLIIIWFGIGLFSKVFLVFFIAVFPILINTITATKNVDKNLIQMAKSFNASKLAIFTKIIFPSSLSFILAGIDLAIGRALTGIIIGELYGSRGGIGYLASFYAQTFQIDKVIAIIFLFIVFSLVLTKFIHLIIIRFNLSQAKMNNTVLDI